MQLCQILQGGFRSSKGAVTRDSSEACQLLGVNINVGILTSSNIIKVNADGSEVLALLQVSVYEGVNRPRGDVSPTF
jgi:inosine-uridine nucleoside N-ribohydrolase